MISRTFSPVSDQKWEGIKQALLDQARVEITTDSGTGNSHGIEFDWSKVGGVLTVAITHVPWLLAKTGHSEDSIMSDFTGWIDGVQD